MLCEIESSMEDDGQIYAEMAKACNQAMRFWLETAVEVDEEIRELNRQMDAITKRITSTAAQRLLDMNTSDAARHVAEAMVSPDTDLNEWLK